MVAVPQTRIPLSFQEIVHPVAEPIKALDSFMEEVVHAFEPEVREMVAYCLEHQGKRLRPLLVFFSGFFCRQLSEGTPMSVISPSHPLIRAAAIVELVHQATLVHDDILDDASLRHNAETPWSRYGAASAVLLGDALFAQALRLASDFETVEVCRVVSEATRKVCCGEIAQTFLRGTSKQDFDHYFRVIDLKTAELFHAACLLGATMGGYGSSTVKAIADFGRHLGIAYQIFDDLADYTGDESRIGKTLGTDLASGKCTLPLLYYFSFLPSEEATALQEALKSGQITAKSLVPKLRESGALHHAYKRFEEEIGHAESALAASGCGASTRHHLSLLSAFVLQQGAKLEIR